MFANCFDKGVCKFSFVVEIMVVLFREPGWIKVELL